MKLSCKIPEGITSPALLLIYHGLEGDGPAAIEEIKKFVAFPGLTPLQPDAYAQPLKRASLSDPPHPSGLPTGRRKVTKQNSCRRQYKMSLQRRLRTVTLDL